MLLFVGPLVVLSMRKFTFEVSLAVFPALSVTVTLIRTVEESLVPVVSQE